MISILHGADLHLDSPFSGLSPELGAHLRSLQRRLPMKLTELANNRGCQLMLLAGDIFDSAHVMPETVAALQQAFGAFRGRVFIAPGNHDPFTAQSPWATSVWPENVHIFQGVAECVTLPELGCRIWGGGFTESACYDGLPQVQPEGFLEIGLFHADPETDGPYRTLTRAQIEASGFDYLALGHIHKTAMPRCLGHTWYGWPGVTMGRGFDETGPRGVFHVQLSQTDCQAEFVPLAQVRYEHITLPVGMDPEAVIPADSAQIIACITRTGENDGTALPDLSGRFYALQVRDETVPARDIWADCGAHTLKGLALSRLKARYDEAATEAQRQRAQLAARYLLAALEGREAP